MQDRIRDNFISMAAPVLERLELAGFEAYLVGGCVREALRAETQASPEKEARAETSEAAAATIPSTDLDVTLNALPEDAAATIPSTDLDVTTNALPEEVCRVFFDMSVLETGLKHGTVTVLVPKSCLNLKPTRGEFFSKIGEFGGSGESEEAGESDGFGETGESGESGGFGGSGESGGTGEAGRSGEEMVDESAAEAAHRIPIEITTYRVDGEYSDGRHPDQVRFVSSLEEDLARRDFTVNAMAMDLRGQIVDPFGGQEDLAAGIIRAVGDPDTRFQEDGLRILRAMRFAAVLTVPGSESRGFRIEPQTEAALFRNAQLLKGISAERVYAELKKLVCGAGAGDVIRRYVDILAVVIPEIAPMKGFVQHNPYHKYEVLEHCIRAMEAVRPVTPPEADGTNGAGGAAPLGLQQMKLAALFHDIGKPATFTRDENGIGHFYGHPQEGTKIVERILRRLKADRFTIDRVTMLVRYHDLVFQEDNRLLKRWMNRYTPQVLLEILELKRADNIATGNVTQELLDKFDRIEVQIRNIISEHYKGEACFSLSDLAVNGRDLMEMGIPEGPRIGALLQKLLDAVIDGEVPNEREALLRAAADELQGD